MPDKFGVTVGLDIGTDKKDNSNYAAWFSPVFIGKMNISKKIVLAGRIEYFYDKEQLIVKTGTLNGFQTWSFSANLDYPFLKEFIWRIEMRAFSSKDRVFIPSNTNEQFITTALCLKL